MHLSTIRQYRRGHGSPTQLPRPDHARPAPAGRPGGGFVHLADVYSVPPERLAERYAPLPAAAGTGDDDDDDDGKIWYFLCPARCRHRAAGAPGDGCWMSSETAGGEVRVVRGADGRRVGHARALSYGARNARVTRRGWCMVELALDEPAPAAAWEEPRISSPPRADTPLLPQAASTRAFFLKRKAVDQHPEAPRS
ncbi:hypothetical protein EJB05_05697, partial [Eragrostis curvula]